MRPHASTQTPDFLKLRHNSLMSRCLPAESNDRALGYFNNFFYQNLLFSEINHFKLQTYPLHSIFVPSHSSKFLTKVPLKYSRPSYLFHPIYTLIPNRIYRQILPCFITWCRIWDTNVLFGMEWENESISWDV